MSKKSNTSKRYTAEFKRDAVALVYSSGKTVTEVAREIGVSPEGLRNWVNQDKVDRGQGSADVLTSDEKEELRRLRRENREQQQTIEILKKSRPSCVLNGEGLPV
ncbi:transposase [Streptomyces hirsutus]|uniref:Transposase n=1 Tax=Streptomyces hirsutus TaxID=35620 RepID=A0ABZ1GTD0_9ACTN|nr:transposase [Streptomyces hirsutus]WSD09449.1 transposase [Streptomyces hirsutus]WTD17100.1 transposase [Streptomyces hirsutus]